MQQVVTWANECDRRTKAALLCAAPATLATAVLLRRWMRNRRLPPGPSGVPLLGCLQLRDQTQWHITLAKVAEQYDGMFSFYCGAQLIIVVTSYSLLKEMLSSNAFTGRDPEVREMQNNTGVAFTEGEVWMHHRRTGLRILRDFGFARPRTVEILDLVMENVLSAFDAASESQKPFVAFEHIHAVSNSVIAQFLFDTMFTRNNPEFAEFCHNLQTLFATPFVSPTNQFPILKTIVKVLPVSQELARLFKELRAYVATIVKEREAVMVDESTEPSCLTDVYIQERRKAEKLGDSEMYSNEQLISIALELFAGGTDTTARSVEWPLLYLAFNPDVQERVHEELDRVVGQSRPPRLSDKSELHYANAVIDESYRMASVVPNGVSHRALEDTIFSGYLIPKDALIVPHAYSANHDPKLWDNPHQFRPDRFLDEEGQYQSSPHQVAFLIGKRACLGESLARMEVFLIFTILMQRYSVKPTADSVRRKEKILTGSVGLVRSPGEYGLIVSKR